MSNTLISFLEGFEPTNEAQTMLRDIVLLQTQIEDFGGHELPLKDAHQNLLNLTKQKYALLVETVNEGSLEQFNSHAQRIKDEIKKFTSEHEMNSITGQKVNSLNAQLESVRAFKDAKEKYGTLKPLDELIKDEKVLMEIFS